MFVCCCWLLCLFVRVECLYFVCLHLYVLFLSVGCVFGMANDRLRALEDVEKEIALVLQSAGLALHKCLHGFNFSTLMLDINLDTGSYSGIWIEIELALNHVEIVLNIIKYAELTSLLTKRSSNQSALTNINTSLLTDTFPTAFKQARVTPLLKKPTLNTSLTDSYRPVSPSIHS